MSEFKTSDLFTGKDLRLAWERVNASVGTDSKDYFGINIYSTNVDKHLGALHKQLANDSFEPTRSFKYYEPKKSGTQRTKSVLRISDAIVYQAIADKVAFQLYDHLSKTKEHVFGSVLNENVTKGAELLNEEDPEFYFFEYYVGLYNRFIEGISKTIDSESVAYKLETDITGFFDCIPHSTLILELMRLGIDKGLLELLATCLNSWSGTRDMSTFHVGIPQGPAASFLFANIILDGLDQLMLEKGMIYFRFMDDIRIYSSSENELLSMLALMDRYLKGRSLSVNTSKTSILPVKENESEVDTLLDSYGIPFEDKTENKIEHDIVIQDQTQLKSSKSNFNIISPDIALKNYLLAIKLIEDDLLEISTKFESNSLLNPIPKPVIRNFLTLAQRWRITVKAIKSIQNYSPRQELIPVWLFGINNIFWKANSMVWNLNLYDSLENYYFEIEKILSDFEHFEWVRYQVLNIYGKVIGADKNRQKKALRDLSKETSPLARLGYYSILVESIRNDSQLFESIISHLKQEKEEYIKESVLNLIHRKHLDISINSLKEWFL